LLPPQETNERHFRLLLAVLQHLRDGGDVWTSVTYFALWSVRLAGFLPDLPMRDDSRLIAQEMLLLPISDLAPRTWTKDTASDLRQKLHRIIEEHVERRLRTAPMLESL
jgi:DNA repair protein RecO (recombination protein O)